jgi:hypothetical protein
MSSCLIVGAGSSKKLLENKEIPIFTISANLHYPKANIFVAMDDPMIENLVNKYKQPVFVTPRHKERRYRDNPKVFSIDTSIYGTGSFSSGHRAIAVATLFGFSNIYLSGFDFDEKGGDKYIREFTLIRQPTSKYIKVDIENPKKQPYFSEVITVDTFLDEFSTKQNILNIFQKRSKNEYREVTRADSL